MSTILERCYKVMKYITIGTLIIIPGYLLTCSAVLVITPITAITLPIEYILFGKTTYTMQIFNFATDMTILKLAIKLADHIWNVL